jgi:hypothetical protein
MVTREEYVESGATSHLAYEVGVYTQGKVGSKAVLAALRGAYSGDSEAGDNMYVWDYRRSDIEGVKQHQVVQGNRRRLLSDDPEIAQFLVDHPDRDLKLTTIVREPIAINISSFFYNFGPRNPEVDINDVSDAQIVDRLVAGESFSSRSYHLDWFDIEVAPMTGIDVYKHKAVPADQQGTIYKADLGQRHTDLLAIRLEDIALHGAAAVSRFYAKNITHIPRENAGDEQAYADRYAAFKQSLQLPVDWVNWQLNSRYARFFYTTEERADIAKKWCNDSSGIL